MVFVRKKKIKGREYYYLVSSTRKDGGWKRVERYIGINPPSKKDLKEYAKEFDSTKEFIFSKKDILGKIKQNYLNKLKTGKKDELNNLEDELITKFTYDTSRIEGSSLTYKDTKMLLQEGISPKEKPLRDIKEAENHKKAFLYMKKHIKNDIGKKFISELHGLLKKDATEDAGKFRDAQVYVGSFVPIKASMIEAEIGNLISWYRENKKLHPLELATVFHCIFERLHPFFDGNGRVGRLLLNFILLKNHYPLIIIQNKNKRRYYNALRRADNGNYLYMIKYLFSELENQDYWAV
ncbi:MAG: Fic family protein [Candidatus Omnitrophica bacterium]|nr:Fic family protein [Candidatus Omnitrophota bacterium]